MTPREDAVVVEGGTERPWHRRDSDIEDAANNLIARTHRGTHVRADAALIVEAVNAYDRLRRVEAAARNIHDHIVGGLESQTHLPGDLCVRQLAAALSEPVAYPMSDLLSPTLVMG